MEPGRSRSMATSARSALATAAADSGAPALARRRLERRSDGGYLMRDAGIPTVLFGPGSIVIKRIAPTSRFRSTK